MSKHLFVDEKITDELFWNTISKTDFSPYGKKIEFFLMEYGTKLLSNRFTIGYCLEKILEDFIKNNGFNVKNLPDSPRIDLCINDNYFLSVKYSSVGNITLHNSMSENKDCFMTDFLLLTPDKLYLITNSAVKNLKLDINKYLINKKDSLQLKRSLLTELVKHKYPFIRNINLRINKNECKHKSCAKLFYKIVNNKYLESIE